MFLDKLALSLAIIGGLNWGAIGLFNFDLVALICGGSGNWLARTIFIVVGVAALCLVPSLFMGDEPQAQPHTH